jgi:ribosomal-protein-alanine N-acetyltransferase
MKAATSFELVTSRLILRDFAASDLHAVHLLRSAPQVARFMDFAPETVEQAEEWLQEVIFHNRKQPREAYNLAIVHATEGQVIGWIGIGASSRYRGELGFGYMLAPAYWNQGYATEAVRCIVDFGFGSLQAPRISAWCYTENHASARVLEKAGLRLERKFEDIEPKSGVSKPCLEYGIRGEAWLASS